MKLQRLLKMAVGSLGLLFLLSCKSNSVPSDFPQIGIPFSILNKYIELSAPDSINTFKINEEVELSVRVTGKENIAFRHDYGARLFTLQDGEWVEVRNFWTYP